MKKIMKKLKVVFLAFLLVSLFVGNAFAGWDSTKDLPGSKDIPGLPRYEGSVISGYQLQKFGQADFPLGKWMDRKGWEKTIRKMGRHTRIIYLPPKDRSALEVMLNYKQSLKESGYETLYECSGYNECGKKVEKFYQNSEYGKKLTDTQLQEYAFSTVENPQLFTGKALIDGRESYIFIFAGYQKNFSAYASEASERVAVFVEEVRAAPMENKMEMIKADKLDSSIAQKGRVAIYGIYFDTDKAVIKPESQPQLEEMASFLKQKPNLNVYIVGHTDSQGSESHNMDLSLRRAQAVTTKLTTDFGISSNRLFPRGVASLAPVTSNDSHEGRAKNRRVEMVQR